jgi:DNA-binding protein HU-beta
MKGRKIMVTKENLAELIAAKHGTSKAEARRIVADIFGTIVEETAKENGKVAIAGFGTFDTAYHAEKQGKNPQTKEVITIPARYVPHFKAGKAFKDKVNENK